jgi:hypothetical protein
LPAYPGASALFTMFTIYAIRYLCCANPSTIHIDYTQWQRNLWPDKTVEEIGTAPTELQKTLSNPW